jgi:hypothetical protein
VSTTFGVDQVVPLNVIAWPEKSTATQKEALAHETELKIPEESTGVADDHVEPLYDHPCPPGPKATQVDADVHETEVTRLDCGELPLALAFAGVVNVHAVTRPAIKSIPVSIRKVRARAWRS